MGGYDSFVVRTNRRERSHELAGINGVTAIAEALKAIQTPKLKVYYIETPFRPDIVGYPIPNGVMVGGIKQQIEELQRTMGAGCEFVPMEEVSDI